MKYTVIAKDRNTHEEVRRVTIPEHAMSNWVGTFLRLGYYVVVT